MRLVGASGGNEGDGLRFVGAEVDHVSGRCAGEDPGVLEEAGGGKIVAAARLVDEGQRDGLSGGETDRPRAEAEAPDLDDDLLRRLGRGGDGDQEKQSRSRGRRTSRWWRLRRSGMLAWGTSCSE